MNDDDNLIYDPIQLLKLSYPIFWHYASVILSLCKHDWSSLSSGVLILTALNGSLPVHRDIVAAILQGTQPFNK